MPETRAKSGTRTVTTKHLTVTLWNVQLACDAIRRVLATMDPTGKSRFALPRGEGWLIKRMDNNPQAAKTKCCPPPHDKIRRSR